MKRSLLWLGSLAAVCMLVSCERANREELELLKKDDAAFEKIAGLKTEAEGQIGNLKAELAQYKAVLDKRTRELRASYDQEAARLGSDIKVLQAKIDSARNQFRAEIDELEIRLAAMRKERDEFTRALADVNDVLAKEGTISLSESEMRGLDSRREDLEGKVADLGVQMQKLQSELILKRKKLRYL